MATKRRKRKSGEPGETAGVGSSTAPALSKSEFIRSRPPGMTAKQVVQAAAALGMSISEHFVYNIRSSAKQRASRKRRRAVPPAAPRQSSASQAAQFRALALELGLGRSRALLDEMERRLSAVIAGR